jgi:hypothetical protein
MKCKQDLSLLSNACFGSSMRGIYCSRLLPFSIIGMTTLLDELWENNSENFKIGSIGSSIIVGVLLCFWEGFEMVLFASIKTIKT